MNDAHTHTHILRASRRESPLCNVRAYVCPCATADRGQHGRLRSKSRMARYRQEGSQGQVSEGKYAKEKALEKSRLREKISISFGSAFFLIYSGKYLQVGGHFQAVCHDLSKPQSLNNGRRSRGTHRLDAHALFAAGLPPSSVIRYQLEQWSSSHKHTSGEFYSRWMAHVALAVSLSLSFIHLHMLGGLRPLL